MYGVCTRSAERGQGPQGRASQPGATPTLHVSSQSKQGPSQPTVLTPSQPNIIFTNQPCRQMLYPVATTPLLNELHGGEFTGMDRESFRAKYPEMWEEREQDKLEFRFPGTGGESYQDVIQRVRPIIVELERQVGGCG